MNRLGRTGQVGRLEIDRASLDSLSVREQQVLSHAADGLLDKQIGAALGVSLNTLRTYWKRIRAKLGEFPRSALAVAYTQHIAAGARGDGREEPEHDWEIDLKRDIYHRVSSRPIHTNLSKGDEVSLDDLFANLHPADEPKLRSLITSARKGELSAFNYTFRLILSTGMHSSGAFAQVLKDSDGKPSMIIGRRVPVITAQPPRIAQVEVGYWTLDLVTGEYHADDAMCQIFQVDPNDPNVREALLHRFHPDEVESCRTFVSTQIAAGRNRGRSTRRLFYDDGSIRWATLDLRIEYDGAVPKKALGTVMVFEGEDDPMMKSPTGAAEAAPDDST